MRPRSRLGRDGLAVWESLSCGGLEILGQRKKDYSFPWTFASIPRSLLSCICVSLYLWLPCPYISFVSRKAAEEAAAAAGKIEKVSLENEPTAGESSDGKVVLKTTHDNSETKISY